MFQHTATRRWLQGTQGDGKSSLGFQHTATRRWLLTGHSLNRQGSCFNTQPPEGGCLAFAARQADDFVFQHTATRRWLPYNRRGVVSQIAVSTHSHPKVAASKQTLHGNGTGVSTHSHPKVAAVFMFIAGMLVVFQHTATRRWLRHCLFAPSSEQVFQHTATRRWLRPPQSPHHLMTCFNTQPPEGGCLRRQNRHRSRGDVSTHSHPKVAALAVLHDWGQEQGFNTQPPEGGCSDGDFLCLRFFVSTHSHPKVAAQSDLCNCW